ncbi:hypothetical protein E4U41_004856 [Claviceps citrina]|nr:hypothetical protein E4U41_004856 [Claviceps citrina]
MSAPAPQLLLRKANGMSNGTAGQPSDQASMKQRHMTLTGSEKARRVEVNSNTSKSGKSKGAVDKRGPSKNANDGDAPQPKSPRSKAHNEGEKVVIRRLPPGMTQQELVTILGPDWEVAKGRVDWFSYIPGKISADPSKPSRPSRAYFHLMRKDDIMPLSEVVRKATWEDAKATFTNPALVGPPVLEFALYKKIAGTKKRIDARQGTIDQDPEFMAFLESLANPVPMRESIDVEDPNDMVKLETKITTTPLVEYLKEKKANKGKDGGSGKNAKSGGKGRNGSKDDDTSGRKRGKDSRGDKTDKNPKDTVKILTKKAATDQAADAAKKVASQMATANSASTATMAAPGAGAGAGAGANAASGDAPKSRRAGIAAAARILQRDLGLSPGSAHRRARHDAAKAGGDAKVAGASVKEDEAKAKDTAAEAATVMAEKPLPAVETPAAQTPKGRPESPAVTKSQSGRRNRGGRNADKGKGAVMVETAATTTASTTVQPTASNNPPVILKKKKSDAGVTPKAAETQPSNQAPSLNGPGNGNGNGNGTGTGTGNNNKQGLKDKGNTKQSQKKGPSVSTNATCAFVKPVSPSQGVNDASLREALGAFGTITLVDIDKRKSFAYVEFSEHDALAKAIAASPLSIGQASVQVLERKDKKSATGATSATSTKEGSAASGEKEKPSGGRGRRGRGGGGGKAGSGSANGQGGNAPAGAGKEAAASTGG